MLLWAQPLHTHPVGRYGCQAMFPLCSVKIPAQTSVIITIVGAGTDSYTKHAAKLRAWAYTRDSVGCDVTVCSCFTH